MSLRMDSMDCQMFQNQKWLTHSLSQSGSQWQGHLLSCQVTAKKMDRSGSMTRIGFDLMRNISLNLAKLWKKTQGTVSGGKHTILVLRSFGSSNCGHGDVLCRVETLLSVWLRWTSLTADHTTMQYWWVIRDTQCASYKEKGRGWKGGTTQVPAGQILGVQLLDLWPSHRR